MEKEQNPKQYDLEDRTLEFAKGAAKFCKGLSKSMINAEMGKHLIRSATSVGANYIEANEALSKKDFLMRIKICRKEAKESAYWFKFLAANNPDSTSEQIPLLKDCMELTKIFGSILVKSQ